MEGGEGERREGKEGWGMLRGGGTCTCMGRMSRFWQRNLG